MKTFKILVTGGAGYIGTHTLVELDKAGYDFVVYDNLSNSSRKALDRVEQIIGKAVEFVEGISEMVLNLMRCLRTMT